MKENGDYLGWWQRAEENGLSSNKLSVRFAEDSKTLFEIIKSDEDDFDIVIVDTKGEAIGYADDLAGVSDALIMPYMNSKGDRERASGTLKWHDDLKACASDLSDRMSLLHWETAMAHSINLINNIYSRERLRV